MINRIVITLALILSTAIAMEPVHEHDDNLETHNPEALQDTSALLKVAIRRAATLHKQFPPEKLIHNFIQANTTASSYSSSAKKEAKKLKRQAAEQKKEAALELIDQFAEKNTYIPENQGNARTYPMAKL
ncbi:MAG: hypothetical protein M1114_06765 [Candidatus Dependentiae bacterium]|nr:hypothetical protein [Candidatus Dependentiae bacterium]